MAQWSSQLPHYREAEVSNPAVAIFYARTCFQNMVGVRMGKNELKLIRVVNLLRRQNQKQKIFISNFGLL